MDNVETGTEQRILEAAQQVFTRDGFDGARMQEIAETAGINKALLHYYFRSKKRLFEKVLEEKMRAFLPEISAPADVCSFQCPPQSGDGQKITGITIPKTDSLPQG